MNNQILPVKSSRAWWLVIPILILTVIAFGWWGWGNQTAKISSNSTLFTSEKFGVRFQYMSYDPKSDSKYFIEESDDNIFIRPINEGSKYPFIMIFYKNVNESFMHAVTRIGFVDNKKDDCKIVPARYINHKLGYETLQIKSISNQQDSITSCQSKYSRDWSVGYFLYNPSVSTKLLFIEDGQDPFPSEPELYISGNVPDIVDMKPSASDTIEIFN
ncbi:MAG: hypothetical protein AAB453_02975 [Patescibacteria group bacterium]